MIIIANKAKLQQALGLFNQLIQQYPSSDKIDDAAYKGGRIYEYLKNYELAAVYYQRAFQWNEATTNPARFRAAKVMDQKLRMRKEALDAVSGGGRKGSALFGQCRIRERNGLQILS